jgi:hypothetical protein
MLMTRRQILLIVALFLVTRVALVAVGVVTTRVWSSTEGEQFTHLLDGGPALDMWYRWDAGFYATIATYGYDWQNEQRPSDDMAFFPLYPLAIRALMPLTTGLSPYLSTQATIAGLIVSNLALLVGALLLFDLARRFGGVPLAWRALWLLLLSPGSIYLSGIYTEGLFFLLCTAALWWLERDKFALAVLAAGLACLTRSVGVALIVPLLWAAWNTDGLRRWLRLIFALAPAALTAAYVFISGLYAGNLLAYFQAYQTTWGRGTGSPIRAFTIYFSGEEKVSLYGSPLSWVDPLATVGYLALSVAVARRRLTWGLFALTAMLIPILTGTLLSMPRFGTVIFPFYVVLAAWATTRPRQALLYAVSIALMILVTARFVTWRWIA